jgi:hypothetical protein
VDCDGVLEEDRLLMEMDVEEVHTGGEQQPRAPTTTISTISVHSGETRLVIALLQVSCTEFELGTL